MLFDNNPKIEHNCPFFLITFPNYHMRMPSFDAHSRLSLFEDSTLYVRIPMPDHNDRIYGKSLHNQ